MRQIPKIVRNSSGLFLETENPQRSLIWLHGLGGSAEDFSSYFCHSLSPLYQNTRIKLLQAPERRVTLYDGESAKCWFDVRSPERFTGNESEVFNLEQLEESRQFVQQEFLKQVKFWEAEDPNSVIPPSFRVFVGGFSQGAVLALHFAFGSQVVPGGVIGLSGYLLRGTPIYNLGKLPTMLMHGVRDPLIRESEARNSYSRLLKDDRLVNYSSSSQLQHTVDLDQLKAVRSFLAETSSMVSKHYREKK